jgi:hypothetical protein
VTYHPLVLDLLRTGFRYRMAGGLRQAMRLWGGLIVAIAVARGLEVSFPVEQWAAGWTKASAATRFGSVAAMAVLSLIGFTPLLRLALRRWGQQQLQSLPLTDRERFAVDYVSILTFLLPPAFTLLAIAALGFQSGGTIDVTRNLATIAATIAATAAIQVRALDGIIAVRALLMLIPVVATGFVEYPVPLAIASLIVLPLLAAEVVYVAAGTRVRVDVSVQSAAQAPDRIPETVSPTHVPGFGAGLFARELFWFIRTAGLSQIAASVAAGWLTAACFILAAANNGVTSERSLSRLCGFFAAIAVAFVAAALARTRDRNRATRALDATLPVSAGQELTALAAVSLLFALAVDSLIMQRWLVLLVSGHASPLTAIGTTLFPLVAAIDYTLLGEQQSRRKRGNVDGPILWLASAFALTAALSPAAALMAAVALMPLLAHNAARAFRLHDLPVTPPEALA